MAGRKRKLTPADERWIRDAVAFRRTLTNLAIARKYRVSLTTIRNIVNDSYWETMALYRLKRRGRNPS